MVAFIGFLIFLVAVFWLVYKPTKNGEPYVSWSEHPEETVCKWQGVILGNNVSDGYLIRKESFGEEIPYSVFFFYLPPNGKTLIYNKLSESHDLDRCREICEAHFQRVYKNKFITAK